jgi:AAA ATPase domain
MLGERQKAAAAELAQWWEGIRLGGIGSQVVLLAGPAGWGRTTVLDQLADVVGQPDAPASLVVRVAARSLPAGAERQAAALRDGLLSAEVRRQAAELLWRSRLRGAVRLGAGSLIRPGVAGTLSLVLAGLAAAVTGGAADKSPVSEDGAAARAARVVAAVSASAPVLVLVDDADLLDRALAVAVIENLIDHHDSQVLVVAAVDLGSDLAAALTARAKYGRTTGRVHRADTDPRMGCTSRAELASELAPHLTAAGARRLAQQTRTFADVFAAARSGRLPEAIGDAPAAPPEPADPPA